MELNRDQIIKALECCETESTNECLKCPYRAFMNCESLVRNDALALIKELVEENERLRGILLQFTDIVHKWGNKYGYDTSEISLVPILNEATAIKSQIEADTVRKMQDEVNRSPDILDVNGYRMIGVDIVDLIAKRMVEDQNRDTE